MNFKYLLILFMTLTFKSYAQNNSAGHIRNGVYKFEGTLGNKMPISMWFVMKDSVLKGELIYQNTIKRQPITILGTLDKTGEIDFNEFTKTGHVTGEFYAMLKSNMLDGLWINPVTEKTFKYLLKRKDTTITAESKNLDPEEINGEYEFDNTGMQGGIDIKHISGNDYLIAIDCVTLPKGNVAEVEKTKVRINGNTIIYATPDCTNKYRIRLFKDFIVIDNIVYGNCFGIGADVSGVFIKTKAKPSFEN